GPDPRNFNQRVSLGRNDLLIRTFPNSWVKNTLNPNGSFLNPENFCLNFESIDSSIDFIPPSLDASRRLFLNSGELAK
ncbi:hypothetical protein QVM89_24875, partial [Serratia marcescens]|nr:hypothetical protein [Serratia marcescens]